MNREKIYALIIFALHLCITLLLVVGGGLLVTKRIEPIFDTQQAQGILVLIIALLFLRFVPTYRKKEG